MLEDMQKADSLYLPTDFWSVCCKRITDEIHKKGLSEFKSHRSANQYYVPLYAKPYYLQNKDIIDALADWLDKLPYRKAGTDLTNFMRGWTNAFNDYRVCRAADTEIPPDISMVSESLTGGPSENFIFEKKNHSHSLLNYLRGLVFLKRSAKPESLEKVLEIGGGFGTLGEILLKSSDRSFYVDIDLPPVAAVSTYYLKEIFGDRAVLDYSQTRGMNALDIDEFSGQYRAIVLCPWQFTNLEGKFDLFTNFISFQEMEPDVVQNYIRLVQRHTPDYVLLRNLREGKKQKDI